MSLENFLKKSQDAAPKQLERGASSSDKLESIYMNFPGNQGFISFIPVLALNGDEVKYLYNVSQFKVRSTTTDDQGNTNEIARWSKIYEPKDYLHQFTETESVQLDKLRGLCSELYDLIEDTDWIRTGKNYALIFGYILSHTNTEGEKLVTPDKRKMALIVIPSKNFAKAMTTCLQAISAYPTANEVFNDLFSRNSSPRQFFLEMSMKQGAGFGYDITVSLKTFDLINGYLLTDDERPQGGVTIPKEEIAKCTNHTAIFAGNYNEDGDDWIQDFMNQAEEQLLSEIKLANSQQNAAPLPDLPKPPTPMSNE